LPGYYNNLKL